MSKYDESTMAIDISNGYFDLVVKSNEDGYYHSIIYSLPCTYRTININGKIYQDDRFVLSIVLIDPFFYTTKNQFHL